MRMTGQEAARKIDALGHALNNLRQDVYRYADFYDEAGELCIQHKAQYMSDIDYIRMRLVELRSNADHIHSSHAANHTANEDAAA